MTVIELQNKIKALEYEMDAEPEKTKIITIRIKLLEIAIEKINQSNTKVAQVKQYLF
jgi:hypothetical protein